MSKILTQGYLLMNFNILNCTLMYYLFIYSKIFMSTWHLPDTGTYHGGHNGHGPCLHWDADHEGDR